MLSIVYAMLDVWQLTVGSFTFEPNKKNVDFDDVYPFNWLFIRSFRSTIYTCMLLFSIDLVQPMALGLGNSINRNVSKPVVKV